MSLYRYRRALRSRTHIATLFLCAFTLIPPRAWERMASKHTSTAGKVGRLPPQFIIMWLAAPPRPIVESVAAVIMFCGGQQFRRYLSNADFSPTQPRRRMRKLFPIDKNSLRK